MQIWEKHALFSANLLLHEEEVTHKNGMQANILAFGLQAANRAVVCTLMTLAGQPQWTSC